MSPPKLGTLSPSCTHHAWSRQRGTLVLPVTSPDPPSPRVTWRLLLRRKPGRRVQTAVTPKQETRYKGKCPSEAREGPGQSHGGRDRDEGDAGTSLGWDCRPLAPRRSCMDPPPTAPGSVAQPADPSPLTSYRWHTGGGTGEKGTAGKFGWGRISGWGRALSHQEPLGRRPSVPRSLFRRVLSAPPKETRSNRLRLSKTLWGRPKNPEPDPEPEPEPQASGTRPPILNQAGPRMLVFCRLLAEPTDTGSCGEQENRQEAAGASLPSSFSHPRLGWGFRGPGWPGELSSVQALGLAQLLPLPLPLCLCFLSSSSLSLNFSPQKAGIYLSPAFMGLTCPLTCPLACPLTCISIHLHSSVFPFTHY